MKNEILKKLQSKIKKSRQYLLKNINIYSKQDVVDYCNQQLNLFKTEFLDQTFDINEEEINQIKITISHYEIWCEIITNDINVLKLYL